MPDNAVAYDQATPKTSGFSLQFTRNISHQDIAAYFHTGGTTGTPKLAQHIHGNEIADAWMASYSFGFRESEVTLTGLRLFHANASIISDIAALSKGVHALLVGKDGFRNERTIGDFSKLAERHKATNFSSVPTIYTALMDIPIDAALGEVSCATRQWPGNSRKYPRLARRVCFHTRHTINRMVKAVFIAYFQKEAESKLPPFLLEFLCGGSFNESTFHANTADLQEIALRARVLRDVSQPDLSTSISEEDLDLPVARHGHWCLRRVEKLGLRTCSKY